MGNRFLSLAALSGFIVVAFGAFASHALQKQFDMQQLVWLETGWKYHAFHTIALLVLGFYLSATTHQPQPKCRKSAVNIIGFSWTIGIVAFSFSLYAMAVFNTKSMAMIVPMGGIAFLVGWATLFYVALRSSVAKKGNEIE
ncbi:DUF423 domain-containing protein [Pasteurellaceae bacterium 22721_9_1]